MRKQRMPKIGEDFCRMSPIWAFGVAAKPELRLIKLCDALSK